MLGLVQLEQLFIVIYSPIKIFQNIATKQTAKLRIKGKENSAVLYFALTEGYRYFFEILQSDIETLGSGGRAFMMKRAIL